MSGKWYFDFAGGGAEAENVGRSEKVEGEAGKKMRECGIEMELRKMGRGERMSRVVELRYINAGTEIKEFIIITTREAMSHSDMPEEQAHSQIYENNPSEHSSCTNRLILTPQQAAYLTKLLPASFSLQTEIKALKRGASVSKSIKEKTPS